MNSNTLNHEAPKLRPTVLNLCTFVAALILTAAACFLLSAA
jgi:hypothetical protein